jgi:hypothetical protein
MGKKISIEEARKNDIEIVKFNALCKNHNRFEADIVVYKNGDKIFDEKNITTQVIMKYNCWNVLIFWDDAGLDEEDYHKLGLFGYYSSGYSKMVNEYKSLIIFGDKGIKINISVR